MQIILSRDGRTIYGYDTNKLRTTLCDSIVFNCNKDEGNYLEISIPHSLAVLGENEISELFESLYHKVSRDPENCIDLVRSFSKDLKPIDKQRYEKAIVDIAFEACSTELGIDSVKNLKIDDSNLFLKQFDVEVIGDSGRKIFSQNVTLPSGELVVKFDKDNYWQTHIH